MSTNLEAKSRLEDILSHAFLDVKSFLDDPTVTDIMLNPDGKVWLDTFSGVIESGVKISPQKAEQMIRVVSGLKEQEVTALNPSIATELPLNGERFQGIIPPTTESPIFSIRKRPSKIYTLEEYVDSGTISNVQKEKIVEAVKDSKNIVIAGATHSGKTTFANAILCEIAALNPRIAILEDTRELQCEVENSFSLKTSKNRTMSDLIKQTLRLNIDRIVVGEIRGGEALELLKAWNTGHPGGLATVHSDSAIDTLYRIEDLISEVSSKNQSRLISRSIDMILYLGKDASRRRKLQEVLFVKGLITTEDFYDTF
jgi:P-type conjugative transfer ATPase TrbB